MTDYEGKKAWQKLYMLNNDQVCTTSIKNKQTKKKPHKPAVSEFILLF